MRIVYFRLMVFFGFLLCSAAFLNAAETPVTINVNASSFIRTIPETMFGGNLTAWDGAQSGGNSTFNNLLIASGRKYQRWPGGSWGDAYLWSDMEGPGGVNGWIVSYSETLNLLNILSQPGETVHPTLQPIVNFPGYWYDTDHSDAEAIAAAVAWVQDQSGRTPTAQYWEIGNEVYGPWEAGWFEGMRGSYYGDKFADFYIAMKAVNPNIKIGAVAQEYDTPDWWNPGLWTRELLVAAYAKGVVPDFLIIHQYPGSDQPASYNPTLLGARVNDIASFTSSLNSIIADTIGPSYVGQVKYWMTEWDSGAVDGSYDRRQCYVNAMFHAQYTMEIAKNNWEGSNAWAQWEYNYTNFFVYPVWYVHPLLINRFGRDMVAATTSNPQVRAYAATDNDNNLTILIVNNYPTTDAAVTVNISGFPAGTSGQRWLIEPAGTMIAGGVNIQDYCDVSINGTVHPNPLTLNSLAPQTFTSDSTFNITLPKSGMVFLKVPRGTGDTEPPAPPTGLSATGGESMVSLDWNDNTEGDLAGYNVYRSLTSGSGYIKINGPLVSSSDYVDNDVEGYVTYYYIVTAVDTSLNESDDSSETSATPIDTTAPSVPIGLTAEAGDGVVSLNWNDNTEGDLAGYNIYRSTTSGSGYIQLNGSLLGSSDYTDNSVTNGIKYYYVVMAVDTSSNESDASGEISATPIPSTVYTFAGITAANTEYNAYACDVDTFPFGGSSGNRNSMVEATDTQYNNISTDDTTEWATVDPGSSDEIFLWVEMKINEAPASISRIDLTFDGYTGGSSDVTYRIYVLTAGADWTQTSSWTQVGSDQSISPGAYATMTRSITSNISNYIDGTGKITWGIYETTSSEATHVNYLEMMVTADTIPPVAPTGLSAKAGIATILLDWNDNSESDLAGYNVYRSTVSGGPYTKQNTSLISTSEYINDGVTSGTAYYYVVTAVDTSSNESDDSDEISVAPVFAAEGTGAVLCEWWTGITGTTVSDLTSDANYPDSPSGKELLVSLEGPVNWADNYGTRIRGYLNPVTTGSYMFWIASDDDSELWLSTDDNPANVSRIAYVSGYTPSRYWTKYPEQQSSPISLTAGQKYYIEVLHKEGDGGDNVAVAWEGPAVTQQVIDGLYLSPCCLDFENFADFAAQWNQTGCSAGNDWCYGSDFSRDGLVSLDDLQAFADAWLTGVQ